ncbi:MAG: glycerophosphodiester phosphodiesterase family protein, partial [Candidatus Izemoplasmatales bacterium]|nr:glycerophosphodiester phosphodiesterase family protein [Candidatus Izemoplasmatales bacterium]
MKNIEWIKTTPIAHRGLHSEDKTTPENSLAAFEAAMNQGYPIELDINILKDDTVIVFHDKDLKRMTGDARMLKDVDYADIQNLKLLKTREKITTLDDVLALVGGKDPLLIELKHHFNAIEMAEILIEK